MVFLTIIAPELVLAQEVWPELTWKYNYNYDYNITSYHPTLSLQHNKLRA